MNRPLLIAAALAAALVAGGAITLAERRASVSPAAPAPARQDESPGIVHCANLIYGRSQTSVCFADEFLARLQKDSHIRANRRFYPVKLDSDELFQYPFVVMTGEGAFTLSEAQRHNLRRYLLGGGFLVASAGCSSQPWDRSFRGEIARVFPDLSLRKLPLSHPIFHTVYDISKLDNKAKHKVAIEALEYEGKVVCVYSPEGLNDTENAGPGCCCCGGNEIYNAIQINANLLAYALTH